jgi:hypothetical protein
MWKYAVETYSNTQSQDFLVEMKKIVKPSQDKAYPARYSDPEPLE